MAAFLKASEAAACETVTTVSAHGGIGLGKYAAGVTYRSGGNGFYYPLDADGRTVHDGGEGYRRAVRGLALPPAYKAGL